jgi:pimeloyl-ACP methyl ester carboxylesterase
MIARITRLLLLLQLLIAAAIGAVLQQGFQLNASMAAILGLVFVAIVRLIISANNFRLASRYRSTLPDHYRIDWIQGCLLFVSEFYASMLSSSWTMPFRRFSRRAPPSPKGLPVLLVHGYGCNSGYWHAMSKALLNADITHHAIDLEPVDGGIDEYVPIVHRAVEQICADTGHPRIVIVAHSMGGLVARAYLREHGDARIARIITLGTPHHGTALAHFGVGLNTQQMRWTASEQEGLSSAWLRRLAAEEKPATYRLFVSIYSHHDNIISPQTSSHLPGAKNIEFHAIGHVALALNARIQAQVIDEIREASSREERISACAASLKPA